MNSPEPPVVARPAVRRYALVFKLGGIVLLILLLQVPMVLTHGVLQERQGFQRQATADIAAVWGRRQIVTGPILAVPYGRSRTMARSRVIDGRVTTVDETVLAPATAYFLPETLTVNGRIDPETRHRGIYTTVVYGAELKLSGSFRPDFAAAGIVADRIDWERARLLFGVSDMHGLQALGPAKIGATEAAFAPVEAESSDFLPVAARVDGAGAGKRLTFDLSVNLQGSEQLEIVPVGKTTSVAIASGWPNPSFCGAALPAQHHVSIHGFTANWRVSYLSRGFPQTWTSAAGLRPAEKIDGAAFGVTFVRPVDGYRLVNRAEKYGILFFVLVFAAFFLFEVTAGLRIHWLQYALVGAGLCLFFLGFLALSEFMATGAAYGLAAAACTTLVSLYTWSFLHTGRRTFVILAALAATYGYLYFVLQSQDYALLAGTGALFVALALVMYCTRRVDWWALELGPIRSRGSGPARR